MSDDGYWKTIDAARPPLQDLSERIAIENENARAQSLIDEHLKSQVGGDHYSRMKIQPIEFIQANRLTYEEGNVIKYVCRHRAKDGLKDLRKAIHYIELMIAAEYPEGGK